MEVDPLNVQPSSPPAIPASAADERADLVQAMSAEELFSFAAHVATMAPCFFDSTVAALLEAGVRA